MNEFETSLNNITKMKKELLLKKILEKSKIKKNTVISRQPGNEDVALSFAQRRMWFLDKLYPNNPSYNISFPTDITGSLNIEILEKSIKCIVNRHNSLRTTIYTDGGEPKVYIHKDIDNKNLLRIKDYTDLDEKSLQSAIRDIAIKEAREGFELAKGPLYRFSLLKLKESHFILLITMHHIISDGWSMKIFINELGEIYESILDKREAVLPKLDIQYSDYAYWLNNWMKGEVLEKNINYWKNKLDGSSYCLELPTDYTRPAIQSFNGKKENFLIPKELTKTIYDLCNKENVTLFMFLLSAFNILLFKYTNQDYIIIGSPIANRNHIEIENLIGCFVNTLALKTDINDEMSVKELIDNVKNACLEAYKYEELPFDKLVDELNIERDLSRQPLCQAMFVLQNTQEVDIKVSDVVLSPLSIDFGVSKCDITLELYEDEYINGWFEYNTDLFSVETIQDMVIHFINIIKCITENLNIAINEINLLDEKKYLEIVEEWNNTEVDYDFKLCMHQQFEKQVEKTPNKIAVIFENEEVTYNDLNKRVNKIAHFLRKKKASSNSIIGVFMERSVEVVVALEGILKSGACYLPLDIESPEERLQFMIKDANVVTIITKEKYKNLLLKYGVNENDIICIDTGWYEINNESDENPVNIASMDDLAYVIYTSGSTGKPKGVMLQHSALYNRIMWAQGQFNLDSHDRVLQKTVMTFDVSVWEFLWPLSVGAVLVMARPGGHKDSGYLVDVIKEKRITTVHFVPSMLRAFLDNWNIKKVNCLKRVICSGEELTLDLQKKFFSLLEVELYNLYGPTEAAIDVTCWRCDKDCVKTTVPIGYPISNIKLYILDKYLKPLPAGVPGELYISGVGVSKGYLNREELTKEKFISNPFTNKQNDIMYKTGDLVKYARDGSIEYLRRIDHQVKIRGLRIELGEIEKMILSYTDVKAATVIVWDIAPENKKLVAYIVMDDDEYFQLDLIKDYLKKNLPDYMIPSKFIVMDKLPVTLNGKINRKELPAPDFSINLNNEILVEPKNYIQKKLASIWREVLKIDKVGIRNKFFELGGDSILSIQVVARAYKSGLIVTPKQIFENQTIEELSKVVSIKDESLNKDIDINKEVKLTHIQEWFFEQNLLNVNHYNQSILLELDNKINIVKLKEALNQLISHHDALRMKFKDENGVVKQYYGEASDIGEILTEIDLSVQNISTDKLKEYYYKLQSALSLESGKMICAGYIKLDNNKKPLLFITAHHLVIDGISWRILLEDLEDFYNENTKEMIKTTSYQQWSELLNEFAEDEIKEECSGYLNQLCEADIEHIKYYSDDNNIEKYAEIYSFAIDEEEYIKALLEYIPKIYHTQINDILLAALMLAINKWSGKKKILIDLEGHGREDIFRNINISRTIGWFTTIYPVVLNMNKCENLKDYICSIKEALRSIPSHGLKYDIYKYLKDDDVFRKIPDGDILFNYLGRFNARAEGNTLFNILDMPHYGNRDERNKRKYEIEVNLLINDYSMRIDWIYNKRKFAREDIEKLACYYSEALKDIIEHCKNTAPVYITSDFPLININEKQLDVITRDNTDLTDIYPLTPMQKSVLAHNLLSSKRGNNIQQLFWTIRGNFNIDYFKKSWEYVINDNDMLRTSFVWKNLKEPLQIVHAHVEIDFTTENWLKCTSEEVEKKLNNYMETNKKKAFKSTETPLMRFFIARCNKDNYKFIWSYFTSLFDNWSWGVILRDVFNNYKLLTEGKKIVCNNKTQFKTYVKWISQQKEAEAKNFWLREINGVNPDMILPIEILNKKSDKSTEKLLDECRRLGKGQTVDLENYLKKNGITLGSFFQSIWALALYNLSRNEDVIYGILTYGRPSHLLNIENIVGLFSNNLPIRAKIQKDQLLLNWILDIQNKQVELRQYDYVSVQKIAHWTKVPLTTLQKAIYHRTIVLVQSTGEKFLDNTNSKDGLALDNYKNSIQINVPLRLYVELSDQINLKLRFNNSVYNKEDVIKILNIMYIIIEKILLFRNMKVEEILKYIDKEND
ncbi:hypothetical protein N496_03920 [Clostridium botulinum A2B3 87]|uniref:non-ribosomal peptide synthetase n=1 Tax=Clostridium botulinum TaxID=1491 RepID=UPI0004A56442|nr:non-ribosomal peptide synthetase [Clostridium botulinum]KEI98762.1 hypothetical protein N496_03920 [Clostridium botulinum A2B3 87]